MTTHNHPHSLPVIVDVVAHQFAKLPEAGKLVDFLVLIRDVKGQAEHLLDVARQPVVVLVIDRPVVGTPDSACFVRWQSHKRLG